VLDLKCQNWASEGLHGRAADAHGPCVTFAVDGQGLIKKGRTISAK